MHYFFKIIYLYNLSLDSFCQKNLFEWGDPTIPHTADAVQLSQGISNYLISEAHKSQHKPISIDQERELMFYNYNPSYTNKDGHGLFEQEYWFDL